MQELIDRLCNDTIEYEAEVSLCPWTDLSSMQEWTRAELQT